LRGVVQPATEAIFAPPPLERPPVNTFDTRGHLSDALGRHLAAITDYPRALARNPDAQRCTEARETHRRRPPEARRAWRKRHSPGPAEALPVVSAMLRRLRHTRDLILGTRVFRTAGLGLLIVLCLTEAAHAQGTQSPRPKKSAASSSAATSNWTGLQGGATGGNTSLAQNFAEPGAHLCDDTGLGPISFGCVESHLLFAGHESSPTLGGFLGYRKQFAAWVLGIEGDLAWKHASTSASKSVSFTDIFGFDHAELFRGSMQQGWDASLRARGGLLLTPSLLAYGTAGFALGEVCDSFRYSGTSIDGVLTVATGSGSSCGFRPGYTIGGGLETIVGDGVKARLEYRYTDLGSFSANVPLAITVGPGCSGVFVCTGNARIDMSAAFQTVRLGLGIDF
jgi:outer membrane immunogenic protein